MIRYVVKGKDGSGREFSTEGTIEGDSPMNPDITQRAFRAAFTTITSGNATYGQPGAGGCHGPYNIISVLLEKV